MVLKKPVLKTQSLIKYRDVSLTHKINPRLKHSYIQINEYGEVILKTPKVSKRFLLKLLEEKYPWIKRTLQKNTKQKPLLTQEIELFGEILQTQKVPEINKILNNIKIKNEQNIQKGYDKFYLKKSKEYILPKIEFYTQKMQLFPKEIKFRKMKRKWGSCRNDGVITYNTNLLKKSPDFIEEVIVHELAHLQHFNHSKAFYELIEKTLSL